jgi:hypothetical protein
MYQQLSKEFGTYLLKYGFIKKNEFFVREVDSFFQIINLQRSSRSTKAKPIFMVNVGVTSKKVINFMNISSVSNLMNNQWESRLENITANESDTCFVINDFDDIERILSRLKVSFESWVYPKLQKVSSEVFLIEDYLQQIIQLPFFSHNTIEYLMILVSDTCPERIRDILPILFKKAKNKNDELFLNEIFKEINKKYSFADMK